MLDRVVIVLLCYYFVFIYCTVYCKDFSPSLMSLFLCCTPLKSHSGWVGQSIKSYTENISILWEPPWHGNAVLIILEKDTFILPILNVLSFILITAHIIHKYLIFAKEWEWFSAFQKSTQRIRTMGLRLPTATYLLLRWLQTDCGRNGVFKGISNVAGG